MLKQTLTISAVVALLTVGSVADNDYRGHGRNSGHHTQQQKGQGYRSNDMNNSQASSLSLSDTQKRGLTFMLEEEKVARDVYIYLSEKWGARVFSNISKAEQRHMNSIERVVKGYNLEVPTTLNEEGIFVDEKLQSMYDELITKGVKSLKDAYEVGVAIEVADIDDLETLLDDRDIPNGIKEVYSHLLRGSQNHLRAFNRRLSR